MARSSLRFTGQAMNSQPDILIVGGGPAGAAAAIHLARGGRIVTLLEQSTAAHHKVCGDFLSPEAVEYLNRLGLDPHHLGALPIHTVRLAAQREIAACDLPFLAFSLTRRSLDEALLSPPHNPVQEFSAATGLTLSARTRGAFLHISRPEIAFHSLPPSLRPVSRTSRATAAQPACKTILSHSRCTSTCRPRRSKG